eukprot:CAMPEP_0201478202 /NCGR_PEP_ID=MMETSP0151_2-20130828/3105_1 /ASSEMBLY_ACC=CAM_ASM_000257 /TAXON_ID=200890 /ORGANISM="Paramoeba atlantica, Strain 621/1 / CCAP 1560/9" /LENGTH=574 /DNA_ID=CAMNT_0047859209 /DNA_START=160 /DNA_END=1881 /DNA_ORIENTATION=+
MKLLLPALFLLLFVCAAKPKNQKKQEKYRFALIAKLAPHWFFDLANDGCQDAAEELGNVECLYMGDPVYDPELQAAVVRNAIEMGVDGIALSVVDTEVSSIVIDEALAAGIPIVTFDSDAEKSNRLAYIGTNNFAFGQELGKLLEQLNPHGGKFGVLSGAAPNIAQRYEGVKDRLLNSDIRWIEVEDSPRDLSPAGSLTGRTDVEPVEEMNLFLKNNPDIDAIIPVAGWAMVNRPEEWKKFVKQHRNVTLVSGDSNALQIQLISSGFANGLAGQLPYEMGWLAMETLLKITEGEEVNDVIFGTTLLEILRFPLVLPDVNVNHNYLDSLVIPGYVFFGLIAFVALGFIFWTFFNKTTFVIRAAQPVFLVLICLGTLILASTLFPLSIDDKNHSQREADVACMAIPWTLSIGFTLTFAALFSKTWRVNRIFSSSKKSDYFQVIKVNVVDVLIPMLVLLALNSITLICWTTISPLKYERRNHEGTDGWNRVISTYGSCVSSDGPEGWVPYVVILLVINFSSLIFALIEAYKARSISVAFSETRYISFTFVLMLQSFVVGIPLLFLVYDEPRDYYVVW